MKNLSTPHPFCRFFSLAMRDGRISGGSSAIFLLLFLFFNLSIQASVPLDIIINEIAWMGTTNSANDEWLELHNNTSGSLNLDGWVLKSDDGTPEIKLSGTIPANGFFLLERTNDNTISSIAADQIYKGALGNSGENLKLYDNTGKIVDEVNCSEKWLAGDNTTKQTMEKTPTGWQTSKNPGGTPKAKNSIVIQAEPQSKPESEKPALEEPADEVRIQQTYPRALVINEILPAPVGPDDEDEWVEIFNQNNFNVDLSEWKIKDSVGKATTYAFPKGTKILSQGFLVLSRPITKITLNNDRDEISLIKPNGEIAYSVSYEKAPTSQSYNRTEEGWFWSVVLTPGAKNTLPNPDSTQEAERMSVKNDTNSGDKGAAAISRPFKGTENGQETKFFSTFLIALTISLFSGILILLVKKKLNPTN